MGGLRDDERAMTSPRNPAVKRIFDERPEVLQANGLPDASAELGVAAELRRAIVDPVHQGERHQRGGRMRGGGKTRTCVADIVTPQRRARPR